MVTIGANIKTRRPRAIGGKWVTMENTDLEDGVLSVLEQQSLNLVEVISAQGPHVLDLLQNLVEGSARDQLVQLTRPQEKAVWLVNHFHNVGPVACGRFLETVCMCCEDMPMFLESQLMSVSGFVTAEGDIGNQQQTTISATVESPAKRPRLDHVQCYTDKTKSLLLQKHKSFTKNVVSEVRLDETLVSLRRKIVPRGRDKAARVQVTASTATSSDLQESDEACVEDRVAVTSLLKTPGQATVLLGVAGSGKTLLMYSLGQRWAQDGYPALKLLFLLEFRQLNAVSRHLSLKDLLFRFFLPAESDDQAEVVLDYVVSNPEKVCFIFDGYDEFRGKFSNPVDLRGAFDPRCPLPMAELLSGLCGQKILPRCTLLVTCRPRDVVDLFDGCRIGELLGFEQAHIREYVRFYFQKRDEALQERAVSHLTSSRHLRTMCHVPALCHLCCVCLDHLFAREGPGTTTPLPATLTQIYFQILAAFLSRRAASPPRDGAVSRVSVARLDSVTQALAKHAGLLRELGRLALDGLEESQIVFAAERLRPELAEFGSRTGLLRPVELTLEDGGRQPGVSFMHLTMQEFLAGLHLMTSDDVSDAQFKKKLTLKTRWTAKNEPKTVFTDSLQLYLCGFLASTCTPYLIQLAGGGAKHNVKRRRTHVVKVLESFAGSANLSGPKMVELCRCAHESQDVQLAAKVGSRQCFELRNIRVTPVDLEALAFVVTAAGESTTLDFGGCSMEPESLDLLEGCRNVEALIFRSRKYDDNFAEALSAVIPKLQTLKRLHLTSTNLTEVGAATLVQALKSCLLIEHVDLSNNNITDRSLEKIMDTFPKVSNLKTVLLGRNIYTWNGLFRLVKMMMTCNTLQLVLVKGASVFEKTEEVHEFNLHFIGRRSESNLSNLDQDNETSKTLVWTDYNLSVPRLKELCDALKSYQGLTKINLSRNRLGNQGVMKLLKLLSALGTIQEVIVSENGVDMEGMVLIADLLSKDTDLSQVDASYCGGKELVLKFLPRKSNSTPASQQTRSQMRTRLDSNNTEQDEDQLRKTFSLKHSTIQPANMDKLCKKLRHCPGMLNLDFSFGTFEDNTIDKLVKNLPSMMGLYLLSLSHVQMSTDGALLLVRSLTDCPRVKAVELRPRGEAFIKFWELKAEHATCKLTQYKLNSRNVEKLSEILEPCARISDLDLSSNRLQDEGVEILMDWLPKLRIGNSVNLNNNGLTQVGALQLVNSISTCEKVVAVDVSLGDEEKSLIRFMQESAQEKSLSLRECNFRPEHLQTLVEILCRSPKLVNLELSYNTLHSESLSILNRLAQLCALQNLEMRKNGLCPEVIEQLFQNISHYHLQWTIRIEEEWMSEEAVLVLVSDCLKVNANIKEIGVTNTVLTVSLSGNANLANHSGNSVAAGSSLTSIGFANSEIMGHHLYLLKPVLSASSLLQEIDLSLKRIGIQGTEFLTSTMQDLRNLRKLSLYTEQSSEDEVLSIVAALQGCPKLESISLSGYIISDEGAEALGRVLPSLLHLKSIGLSQGSLWSAQGALALIRGVGQCSPLEGIRLDHIVLFPNALICLSQWLQQLTFLRCLRLNRISMGTGDPEELNNTVVSLMESLQGCTRIEQIELEGMRLGDSGVQELTKHIPNWTKLRQINLADTNMSDSAGERLVQALTHCSVLEELNLSKNRLGYASMANLGEILSGLTHLRIFNLSENQVTADGAMSLSTGLKNLKHLTKLHLISIGTTELASVADSLRHCVNIEDISLAWNNCGDEVASVLAKVLPKCVKLRWLDLECNRISMKGARSLAESLRFSFTVEVVRLWRNPISKDEGYALRQTEQRLSFSST
ncbi:NLR family, CARD domain containing 5 [Sardina pilchardus]|uniref:NLR family, CARD domain containing 5 n=1 Tax=Sardina pilchardus TaxID=27697 RepID=UPI002E12AF18